MNQGLPGTNKNVGAKFEATILNAAAVADMEVGDPALLIAAVMLVCRALVIISSQAP